MAQMKTTITGSLAVVLALVSGGSLLAHHSLANFDTTTPVRVKGTVVEFHHINPHSFIFMDGTGPDGQMRRWAVEGPTALQIGRRGLPKDFLKAGDVVEVCGYAHKETVVWQIASPDPKGRSTAGRLLNAELLIMPDGQQQSWGDYGVHLCFPPGYTDQHSRVTTRP